MWWGVEMISSLWERLLRFAGGCYMARDWGEREELLCGSGGGRKLGGCDMESKAALMIRWSGMGYCMV